MYVDSSTSVRVKAGESERLRNDFGVRQVCIMFPWIFNVYIDAAKKEVKMGIGRRRDGRTRSYRYCRGRRRMRRSNII